MNWKLFTSTFSLVFVAELPDKTAMATLLMATRGRPWPLFIGVAAAFVVQTAVAVVFGDFFGRLPQRWVHLAAGVLFLIFAYAAWTRDEEADQEKEVTAVERAQGGTGSFWRTAGSSFLVIFIAEWGDLTQLASASLVARFRAPVTIFTSSVLALWCVTALAIVVGNRAKNIINAAILQKIAAVAFFGVGMYFLVSWFMASSHG